MMLWGRSTSSWNEATVMAHGTGLITSINWSYYLQSNILHNRNRWRIAPFSVLWLPTIFSARWQHYENPQQSISLLSFLFTLFSLHIERLVRLVRLVKSDDKAGECRRELSRIDITSSVFFSLFTTVFRMTRLIVVVYSVALISLFTSLSSFLFTLTSLQIERA